MLRTCDGCAEQKEIARVDPETEAYVCADCWAPAAALERLRAAVTAYDGKIAEYAAHPDHGGLRMGFGAVKDELIEAARAVAHAE